MVWKIIKKIIFFLYFHIQEVLSDSRECGSQVAFPGDSPMIREGSLECSSPIRVVITNVTCMQHCKSMKWTQNAIKYRETITKKIFSVNNTKRNQHTRVTHYYLRDQFCQNQNYLLGRTWFSCSVYSFYSEQAEFKSSAVEQLLHLLRWCGWVTWPVPKKHGGPISASTQFSFWKIYFCISFQKEVKFTNMIDHILYVYCVFLLFFHSIYIPQHILKANKTIKAIFLFWTYCHSLHLQEYAGVIPPNCSVSIDLGSCSGVLLKVKSSPPLVTCQNDNHSPGPWPGRHTFSDL